MIYSTGYIAYSMRLRIRVLKLIQYQLGKIVGMKRVPNLKSVSAEADVAKWFFGAPGVQPKRKNALFRGAELSGARKNAAAVDPNGNFKCVAIFQSQGFRSKFSCSIQRYWSSGAELFPDSSGRNSLECDLRKLRCKSLAIDLEGQFAKRSN